MTTVKFEVLKGQTLVDIHADDAEITFITKEGNSYKMYHDQDCCEDVRIDAVVGDWKDLLGNPLLMAEESTNHDNPPKNAERYLWTFYKLATIKGYVDIIWLGESNGCYSESVSLVKGRAYNKDEIGALIARIK